MCWRKTQKDYVLFEFLNHQMKKTVTKNFGIHALFTI